MSRLRTASPRKIPQMKMNSRLHQKTPLQILVEEAEASDSSDDFGSIVPSTPPPVTEEESPVAPLIMEQPQEENPAAIPNIEQPAQELSSEDSDEDEDYEEEEEDEEDDEFLTLKEYYAMSTSCFVTT